MSSGQKGTPPGSGQNINTNSGNVYATQTGNININNNLAQKRGPHLDTKALLVVLPANVIFFLYGMSAYTGRNTSGDNWRAGIFLFMLLFTLGMIGRWVRRRF
ncbi:MULTISPECIES: hypothetical protein [unclassified Micromonospora]|uniref:hypothetical protein n=1 Tax=unclassified Micromonospora TaxID=2617518 RepID=UPI00188FA012|nr:MULTISPECIES: hypothetical protein [unclassified Micromonospora]MBF5028557.1 hypothetical protein [Micromonospora sp. ANENR4]MCZ7472970.1 hypothetical protein [Micromonospora sp. WMMC273]WBC03651.1 hypothetical protein O7546_01355 [Micromonospora sp. WMMA1976]